MEQIVGLKFTGSGYFDPEANNGLGEYKAYFAVVKHGHEDDATNTVRAFGAAGVKSGIRVRDGVIALSRKQLEQRIAQLESKLQEAGA